jgi:tryptophan synthase alpha chain
MRSVIARAIRSANDEGRPALAAFVTGGFSDLDAFPAVLASAAAEADLVEIGVPFSDPMADGLTIQRSSRIALEAGATLAWILDVLRGSRREAPVLLMSYLNPLLAFGLQNLELRAAEAGVAGFVVPDLPLEESGPFRDRLDRRGMALVQLVTPVTPPERIARICAESRGFVYAVTMTGTTGERADEHGIDAYLRLVRERSPVPVLAGFGIRSPEQVQALGGLVDGVIVGSALVEALERGDDPVAFLRNLTTRRPAAAVPDKEVRT